MIRNMEIIENDMKKIKIAIELIIKGLVEKDEKKRKNPNNKYIFSQNLKHGYSIFQEINFRYSLKSREELFQECHETAFFEKYGNQPIKSWFKDWNTEIKNIMEEKLSDQSFYNLDKLIYKDIGNNNYTLTSDAIEYLEQHIEKNVTLANQQKAIYDKLILMSEKEYVELRKFFIENPVLSKEEYFTMKMKYVDKNGNSIMNDAYEEIIEGRERYRKCNNCHWIYDYESNKICQCQIGELRTINLTKDEMKALKNNERYRLKPGVHKYIMLPGILELEIYDFCNTKNLNVELWPYKDKYDLQMIFDNGEIWVIDAKEIKNPYILGDKIIEENGLPNGEFEKGFYVISDKIAKNKGYFKIVNDKIVNSNIELSKKQKISCISFEQLKRKINKRLKEVK